MYRVLTVIGFALFSVAAQAQGYVGAVAALSSVGVDCSNTLSCDKKGRAVKLYAGTKLAGNNQIDFGVGKLTSIEFGMINFGKAESSRGQVFNAYDPNNDGNGGTGDVLRVVSRVGTANALTLAAVADFPVTNEFSLAAKLGVAYVSSTLRTYVDGVANGSETETKLKPYLGLGASLSLADTFKVVGSYDLTAFDVAGRKSRASALGVGAEISF